MSKLQQELITHIKHTISNEVLSYTYSKMCYERVPLKIVDCYLYNQIDDMVQEFIQDNDLTQEWFEENFIDVEAVFEECLDNCTSN